MKDNYNCSGMDTCPEMECGEDICLNYGDCIWYENKRATEKCEECKYKGGGRYADNEE